MTPDKTAAATLEAGEMTLEIFDCGRMKKSAQFKVSETLDADDVAHEILRAVRRMKALGSRGIDVEWNAEENIGVIYVGGLRAVGYVRRLDTPAAARSTP